MDPRAFYEQLVSQIDDADVRKVAQVMLSHVGEDNHVTRAELAVNVFGKFTDSTDRKVRMIIAKLRIDHHMPIGSHSGKAGYWLCSDEDERTRAIMDLTARNNEILNTIRALRLSKVPPKEPKFEKAVQNSLWS